MDEVAYCNGCQFGVEFTIAPMRLRRKQNASGGVNLGDRGRDQPVPTGQKSLPRGAAGQRAGVPKAIGNFRRRGNITVSMLPVWMDPLPTADSDLAPELLEVGYDFIPRRSRQSGTSLGVGGIRDVHGVRSPAIFRDCTRKTGSRHPCGRLSNTNSNASPFLQGTTPAARRHYYNAQARTYAQAVPPHVTPFERGKSTLGEAISRPKIAPLRRPLSFGKNSTDSRNFDLTFDFIPPPLTSALSRPDVPPQHAFRDGHSRLE